MSFNISTNKTIVCIAYLSTLVLYPRPPQKKPFKIVAIYRHKILYVPFVVVVATWFACEFKLACETACAICDCWSCLVCCHSSFFFIIAINNIRNKQVQNVYKIQSKGDSNESNCVEEHQ